MEQKLRRGYFAIGVEGVSKAMNAGSLFRTGHAFGASFVFTVGADLDRRLSNRADTSDTQAQVPFYSFPDLNSLVLPHGCQLVGIELVDDAIDLPSFRHPPQAAYVLGPERGRLSDAMLERCAHVVRIPTRFCINVAIAGAVVMYDRTQSLGRFARRPVSPGQRPEPLDDPVHGEPIFRRAAKRFETPPPLETEPTGERKGRERTRER